MSFDWSKPFNRAIARGHDYSSAAMIADDAENDFNRKRRRSARMSEQAEHIMQFFAYAHLPVHLQEISRPFGEMAEQMVATLPRNPERTVALRKLLEAKDAAVRAKLAA